jgi:hypothetical protein
MKSKAQPVQPGPEANLSSALSPELRGWIERVIVPILVELYQQKNRWKPERTDG